MYLKKPLEYTKNIRIKILLSKMVCCRVTNTDTYNILGQMFEYDVLSESVILDI